MRKSASRGQALVETAIMLPLILFSIYLLFWVSRYTIVNERMYRDVRYANEIGNAANSFTSVSLPALYNSGIASFNWTTGTAAAPAENVCAAPPSNFIASTWGGLAQVESGSIQPDCQEYRGGLSAAGLSRDLIFNYNEPTLSASFVAPVNVGFGEAISAITLRPSGTGYFSFPELSDLTLCFPDLETAVQGSLIQGAMAAEDGSQIVVSSASDLAQLPPTASLAISPDCLGSPKLAGTPPTGEDVPPPYPGPPPETDCYITPCGEGGGTRTGPQPINITPPVNGPGPPVSG